VKLAADANVLLAAVLGGRARLILGSTEIEEIFTAQATFTEVEEYAAVLAIQFEIPVWSNDRDFEDSGIQRYTTEDLLRKLRMLEGKQDVF
jgi:predicted nucleic acid-binding protein